MKKSKLGELYKDILQDGKWVCQGACLAAKIKKTILHIYEPKAKTIHFSTKYIKMTFLHI
jgi:hypothetical protein